MSSVWSVSADFTASLRFPHSVATEVDVYLGDVKQNAEPLKVMDGSVTVDASSKVRRTLDLTLDHSSMTTEQADALLSPFGRELHVRTGIRFPNGVTELVPVGVFRYDADSDDITRAGGLKVSGPDRARAVQGNWFSEPTAANVVMNIPIQIGALIGDTFPSLTLQDMTGSIVGVPAAVWDADRWDACIDLATSIGAEVYFRADGIPVLRPLPQLLDSPVWVVDAGQTGVLVGGDRRKSREKTYSGVTARGERTDGTPPVAWTIWDAVPSSPTYYLGPFGKVLAPIYTSPFITDPTQAQAVANALLPKYTSQQRQLTLEVIPNPALDVGDTIDVVFPDSHIERHLIERLTVPLTYEGSMTVGTRSDDPESA